MRDTSAMSRLRILECVWIALLMVFVGLVSSVASGLDAAASASSYQGRGPVLGQRGLGVPTATGWGTYEPKEFFNGGDPSGHVAGITWNHWGSRAATGRGRGVIFKPDGGYYPGTVQVDLRAFDLGHCTHHGPLAYERLNARYPSRPGGKLGKWTPWSGSLCITPNTTTTTGTTTVPANGLASTCRNGQISVTGAFGGAALGHEGQILLFTNTSQSTCILGGYPGVAGLGAQGNQVVQAERSLNGYLGGLNNGATTPPIVVVTPGQSISALVEGTDVPVAPATSCPSYPAPLVTPPNLTVSVRVPLGLFECSPIQIHPVVPGSSGRVQ
jgi:hypothetical protein